MVSLSITSIQLRTSYVILCIPPKMFQIPLPLPNPTATAQDLSGSPPTFAMSSHWSSYCPTCGPVTFLYSGASGIFPEQKPYASVPLASFQRLHPGSQTLHGPAPSTSLTHCLPPPSQPWSSVIQTHHVHATPGPLHSPLPSSWNAFASPFKCLLCGEVTATYLPQ